MLPIVNTYASFYKRAIDQISVNSTEHSKVIYAGHYGGLCYHSDGRSHQSLNDFNLFSALPNFVLLDPVSTSHTQLLLDWAVHDNQPLSAYFRLRRTHIPELEFINENIIPSDLTLPFVISEPRLFFLFNLLFLLALH